MGTHSKPEPCASVIARREALEDPAACPGCGENPCRETDRDWLYAWHTTPRGLKWKKRTNIRTGEVVHLVRDYRRVVNG